MGITSRKGPRENGNENRMKMVAAASLGTSQADEVLSKHIHVYHRPRILVALKKGYPDLVRQLRGKEERIIVLAESTSSAEDLSARLIKGTGRTDLLVTDHPHDHSQTLKEFEDYFPYASVIVVGSPEKERVTTTLSVEYVDPSELQNLRTFIPLVERILVQTEEARRTYRGGEELVRDLHAAHDLVSRIDNALKKVLFPGEEDVTVKHTPVETVGLLQSTLSESQFALAHRLLRRLYHVQPPQGRGHTVFYNRFSQGVTESGALGIDYEDEPFVLKRVSRLRAATVVRDSRYFEACYTNEFPIEHVHAATVSKKDASAYLWKEFVPGPTLSEVLGYITHQDIPPSKLQRTFRRACIDVAIDHIDFWERHALPVTETQVAKNYLKNLFDSYIGTARRLRTSVTPKEAAVFEQGIAALGYAELVTSNTIVRKAESALVNMILRLPDYAAARLPLEDQVHTLITLNRRPRTKKFDLEKIKQNTVQVDTADRYSHALENIFEVLESPETGLSASKIGAYLEKKLDNAKENVQPALRESVEAMGFYRVMRKLYFVCEIFGPDAFIEAQRLGRERSREFKRTEERYLQYIKHYSSRAIYWLNKRVAVEEQRNVEHVRSVSADASEWYAAQHEKFPLVPPIETYREHLLSVIVPAPFAGNEQTYTALCTGVEKILLFRMMAERVERFGKNGLSIDYTLQE